MLHQRDVLPRIQAGPGHSGEELELVAEAPVADLLALQVGRRVDALSAKDTCGVPERWKTCADLGDLRALLPRGQRLGHPGDREVRLALGEDGLRHDVHAALEDLHVEALVRVEALVARRRSTRRTGPA